MSSDQAPRPPGPRGGIPASFSLLFVFGLMAAGIIALAGFAIDKGAEKDNSAALDPANAAAAELYEANLFIPDQREKDAEVLLGVLDEDAPVLDEEEPAQEDPSGEEEAASEAPVAELDNPDALLASADAETGRELFFANSCNQCHGDNGEGLIGPTIAQTGFSLAQVVGQYRTPRGLMPPFGADRVSDQDVAHIYVWLQTLELPDTIIGGLGTP